MFSVVIPSEMIAHFKEVQSVNALLLSVVTVEGMTTVSRLVQKAKQFALIKSNPHSNESFLSFVRCKMPDLRSLEQSRGG